MHIVEELPPEVDTVVLAVSYMKEVLEKYFQEHDCGRKVILVNEEEPLGTGGAIRNVRQHLDGAFFCFNGDIISSLDLSQFLRFHQQKGGIGTLALRQVYDPSAFGVVGMHEDRITTFQEKPAPGSALSDLINAGIYVFEPELLDHIGDGVVSLERDVFPQILGQGLYGHRFSGYWVDCGTLSSYLTAQSVLIENGSEMVRPAVLDGAQLIGRNHIDGAILSCCRVGPHVCALPGSRIMDSSEIMRSVLMEGATVGRNCIVQDCILGPGVSVPEGQVLRSQVLVRNPSMR